MTEEVNKTPEDTPQRPEAERRLSLHSGFDDQLSFRIPLSHIESSIANEHVRRSWVASCRRPARLCRLRADKKYEQVAMFLRAFPIQNSNRANIFLSKQSVLFLREMVWLYGTAAVETENDLLTEVVAFCSRCCSSKMEHQRCHSLLNAVLTC